MFKRIEPSEEVAAMEALAKQAAAMATVTQACADFYNGLRGQGLPDEVACLLTNTWLGTMMAGSFANTGEEGEGDD